MVNIYPRNILTVSLTKDEVVKIAELMKRYGLNQHAIIKFCLRWVLFPDERERMPIDGYLSGRELSTGEVIIKDEPRIVVTKESEKRVILKEETEE